MQSNLFKPKFMGLLVAQFFGAMNDKLSDLQDVQRNHSQRLRDLEVVHRLLQGLRHKNCCILDVLGWCNS